MESVQAVLAVVAGLALRFGIPIALTILAVLWMRHLDARWKKDADEQRIKLYGTAVPAHNTRCWDVKKCTEAQKAKCTAYAHPELPCWQVFRDGNGALREGCLDCQVFRLAPLPVVG